jgi:hypothetical protein
MIVDKFLTYDQKVAISVICGCLWIYFRTSDCYLLIPRLHLFPVVFVGIWIYLNYYDPLWLPIGLIILIIYAYVIKETKDIHLQPCKGRA